MKKLCLLVLSAISYILCFSQDSIAIIPQPVKLIKNAGVFTLPASIGIWAGPSPYLKPTVNMLTSKLTAATGYGTHIVTAKLVKVSIGLLTNETPDNALGDEGYHLTVTPKGVTIRANTPAGIFYGVQTMLQLLPPQIESKTIVHNVKWQLPCVDITDYPRFVWRGLMLDVSRHFFTKQQVKDFIDQMVKYKYNILHMHLTDDQGWRIEIMACQNSLQLDRCACIRKDILGAFLYQRLMNRAQTGAFIHRKI